jgi:hypothetical protein
MEVGVPESPDAWTHHRMKHSVKAEQGEPHVRPKRIHDTGVTGSKTVELFDLCAADSDERMDGAASTRANAAPITVRDTPETSRHLGRPLLV